MFNKLLLAGGFCALLFSCSQHSGERSAAPDILYADIDSTVSPSRDFFDYANGGWIRQNPIPPEQSYWGIGNLVVEENLRRIRTIIEKAASANAPAGSAQQKVGDFWTVAMDSARIDTLGLQPLQPELSEIGEIRDTRSFLATVADLRKIGVNSLFDESVDQDARQSDVMAYNLNQGGLGLPEREYYFKNDSETIHIRQEYVRYIGKVLTMSGDDSTAASRSALSILALETLMARASRKLEDLRDPVENYHKISYRSLEKLVSNIDWPVYLDHTGLKKPDSVIVGQPEFFESLDKILKTTPVADWKNYLRYSLINTYANALPDEYGAAAFQFNRLFSGAQVRKPRWKLVLQSQERMMGELLGQLYVKDFFTEKAKKRYEDMVEAMRSAFKDRIAALGWMSDSTKQKAYIKLAAIRKKVGYPDKWKDFSTMKIGRESYVQNLISAREWWHAFRYSRMGKPVDRDEWGMYPQTYNAQYNPSNNDITLPAAQFIVPGYKDEDLDDALVYGYSGASTIGHEMTHGFDDQGRQFDAAGNLKNWWTKKDEEAFKQKADLMVRQFDEYEPIKGYHINGKASLGENIADLGGIVIGIDAFRKTDQYKSGSLINGQTPMQRFFLGYALGWLGQERPEVLRNLLMTDVHAPGKYRVNGPFSDVDEFYTAFNIKKGDPMYREDSLRVRIW
jgi:putative endopeptidase